LRQTLSGESGRNYRISLHIFGKLPQSSSTPRYDIVALPVMLLFPNANIMFSLFTNLALKWFILGIYAPGYHLIINEQTVTCFGMVVD